MPEEIEKKYLIRENGMDYATDNLLHRYVSVQSLKELVMKTGKPISQGYLPLSSGSELSDRLNMIVDFKPSEARLRNKSGKLYFTLKGSGGLSRSELEMEIDQDTYNTYWPMTEGKRVEKVRLAQPFEGHTIEIDVYTDRDLVIAEIEVPSIEEAQRLTPLGKDVTNNNAYKNKNLAR